MKLAVTLAAGEDPEVLDAQLAFHLHAGADVVVVSAPDGDPRGILDAYASGGAVRAVDAQPGVHEDELVNRLAALAVSEEGADWVIDARPAEFWWPRGESLKDALVAIPERYAVVQALVREFVRVQDGPLAERVIVRRSPVTVDGRPPVPLERALRRAYRAAPRMAVRPFEPGLTNRVPLRAWYPIEVLVAPARSAEPVASDALERGLAEGSLVRDERLRDALRAIAREGGLRRFALPAEAPGVIAFRTPDVVDDAAYAVDCAAVGEVDLARLDRHIRELEDRIRWLEDRFWPRVMRTMSRLVHRG